MICYKDRSYCSSETCVGKCGRKITKEELKHAAKLKLPICYGKFCDEKGEVIDYG